MLSVTQPNQSGGWQTIGPVFDRRALCRMGGELKNGYYVQPTVFQGHNRMRLF
ncbi:MAG: hypothetical protein KDJ28_13910 [Candidatus Competibacteraceae bacterium]|nr:hypothetical protein [Candidatus Competibacteraceae bacterium]